MNFYRYATSYIAALHVLIFALCMVGKYILGIDTVENYGLHYQGFGFAPLQVLAYSFFHYDAIHLIFNLSYVLGLGYILELLVGTRKLIGIYLFGIVFSVFCFFVATAIDGKYSTILIGSSGCCMAMLAAATHLMPLYNIRMFGLFNLQLRELGALLMIFEIVCLFTGWFASMSHAVHLGVYLLSTFMFWLTLRK